MPLNSSGTVLKIDNVSKSFGTNIAINKINLEVFKGEVFGFLGPNGAGKSTTIRLLLDVLRPDSGKITIFNRSNREIKATHSDIGFLSGEMVLDNDLTGRQYLSFINHIYGNHYADQTKQLATKLQANLNTKIGDYSRGNRQKIGLISALLHQPKLLVLDEPTSGFDPLVQETFAELIKDFCKQGGTVFMSSHLLNEVQQLCDRIAFIKDGLIIDTKTIQELTTTTAKRIQVKCQTSQIKAIKNSYKQVPHLMLIGEINSALSFNFSGDINKLLQFFSTHQVEDITIREPDLEEIFNLYYQASEIKANQTNE